MLSVVVPAFREGESLRRSLERLRASLGRLGTDYEVVVVVDGGDRATAAAAASIPGARVHSYEPHRGKGHALRQGIARTTGDLVAYIDADMELDPDGIEALVARLDPADVVVGSKRHPDSQVRYPPGRRLQSALYRALVQLLFRLGVSDTQAGLKVFRGDVVRAAAATTHFDGFAFDLELLVALRRAGARIVEGPVHVDYAYETSTSIRATSQVLADTVSLFFHELRRRRRQS